MGKGATMGVGVEGLAQMWWLELSRYSRPPCFHINNRLVGLDLSHHFSLWQKIGQKKEEKTLKMRKKRNPDNIKMKPTKKELEKEKHSMGLLGTIFFSSYNS